MGSGFFSQDNPDPIEQAPAGPGPGNVVVQEPTGVDGATASFFGRGASPELQAFEQDAKQYAEEAAASASAADTSADQAEAYKVEAAAQALAADNSADSALASQNAASTSATNAASSATSASASASNAATSASGSSTSATNAAASASAAAGSATSASTSATNAANSASAAAGSATDAASSASAASTSATNAASSATSASGSAATATTKASEAATSATNAASSATAAAGSASSASGSATSASGSASSASTSATNAANSATAASNSASAASTSATNAASAQTAAESARDATLAAFDSFDDRYLGPKTSNPTVDNDGNALVAGALYFNSTVGEMRVYTGTVWTAAYVSGSGVLLQANNLSDVADATTARGNISAAKSGSNSDITSLNGVTDGISTPDYVQFSTTGATGNVARLLWNDSDGTLEFGLKGGNVTLQVGQEQVLRATNATGATLVDGTVVYITGSTGSHVNIVKAQANAETTSSKTIGVVTEHIADNQSGFVTTSGLVHDLDTSALTEGGAVWLSASTAGGLTSTRPTAPNHAVLIGWCVKSHASVGVIYVHVMNGYELDELHDVLLTSKANNDVLSYESSSGLWKNRALATVANTGAYSDLSGKPTNVSSFTNDSGYLTSFTETDPVYSASAAAGITSTNITNWNTAYSWGNHASAGYLTSSAIGSTVQGYDADLGAIAALSGTTGLLKKTAANTWTLDTSTYLTGITSGQVTTALGYTPYSNAGGTISGNVGIGTSAPGYKLDISGSGDVTRLTSSTTSSGMLMADSGGTIRVGTRSGAAIFDTGGSERMRIDSAGNVGIGTSSPSFKLDVFGTSSTTMRSYSTGTAASTYAAVNAGTGEGVNSVMYSYQSAGWYGLTTNHPMLFMTNNTERMRIDSSGNVGIGTSSPAGPLSVVSTANGEVIRAQKAGGTNLTLLRVNMNDTANTGTIEVTGAAGNPALCLATVGVERVRINDVGNVGIGTSSPSQKLDVSGVIKATVGSNTIYLNPAFGGGAEQAVQSAGPLLLCSNNNERMRIDSAGNVGIGTSSPGSLLEIRKDQNADTVAKVINSNTGGNATARLDLATGTANAYCIFALKDNGGSPYGLMSSGSAITGMYYDMAAHIFRSQGGTECMRIDSAGNVGIGNNTPGCRLDVSPGDTGVLGYALRLRGNSAYNAAAIQFTDNAVSTEAGYIYCGAGEMSYRASSTRYMSFWTNSLERLRIDGSNGTLTSLPTYNNTATGSTVVVTSAGLIRRTSSSIKYKKDVESLDPALATNAIDNLRPVWYRTKNAEGDDKATWSHIGLIAEEVDKVEPRLVRYRTDEVIDEQKPVLDEAGEPVLDEEGNPTFTTEQVVRELAVPEPEDVDYARLSVLLLAEVRSLRERIAALEAK